MCSNRNRCFLWMTVGFMLAGTVGVAAPADVTASNPDSVVVTLFFRVNEAVIDPFYLGNEESLDRIRKIALGHARSEITHIAIAAESSPEGNPDGNHSLALRRAQTIEDLLLSYLPETDPAVISKTVSTRSWAELRPLLEQDDAIPHKQALMKILDDPRITYKEWPLRTLEGGSTYAYLKNHVLLFLRTGRAAVTIRCRSTVRKSDTVAAGAKPASSPAAAKDTLSAPRALLEWPEPAGPVAREPRLLPAALKTNLLFDLVGAPNIGIEWLVGKKTSVAFDAAYAYWRINNLYALQTIQVGAGAKYWFGSQQNRPLTGWNAGGYAMVCSRYDVQWRDGYQGDGFWSAGLSAGYATRVGERLNLEFLLAAGYFHTPEVRHYHRPESGDRGRHLMWQQTRFHVGRVTLTKMQVNLVWLIGKNRTL